MTTPHALQAHDLAVSFGRFAAVDGVDLALAQGARHALIGPNGAGKTTLIGLLAGTLAPTRGRICLDGADVTHLRPDERVRRGLVRTFQINSLFPDLTARSSVVLVLAEREGLAGRWWRPVRGQTALFDEAAHWLDHLGLAAAADIPVKALAYGQQRLLEIALALACRPRVLLLDEPAAGLPAGRAHAVLDAIDALPSDIAVLLIEHDMSLVFRFARELTVLAQGRVLAHGEPSEIANHPAVREVYLGPGAQSGGAGC